MQRDFQPTVYLLERLSLHLRNFRPHPAHPPAPEGAGPGFTREHNIKRLVWFEQHSTMEHAITREKRIKKWNRVGKLELIERDNLGWRDLADDLGFPPIEPTGSPLSRG